MTQAIQYQQSYDHGFIDGQQTAAQWKKMGWDSPQQYLAHAETLYREAVKDWVDCVGETAEKYRDYARGNIEGERAYIASLVAQS